MTTVEDVFYLYENNSSSDNDVIPYSIGDNDVPCRYKIKCYVKPGDECPICYEEIWTKTSAYITGCGHHYHKKCLFNYIKSIWLSNSYCHIARCPLCRYSLGYPDFIKRYRSSYFAPLREYKDNNELDKLEDFWLTHKYRLPEFCSNGYRHYLGCKSTCFICKNYREKGEIIYEL